MKPKLFLLTLILVLAAFLRLYQLNSFPPALFSDEVDAGYQAMVFNHYGTDYFGNMFPVHFHSFSDWRTSADIYAIALCQKLFVSPELSVRLPSAIFSLLSILAIYCLTDSLVTAFLLAISPWSIHYGRTGFEVSGMIFCLLLGSLLWKKYLGQKRFYQLLLCLLAFGLSTYFYSTAKLFIVFLFFTVLYIWRHEIIKFKKSHLISSTVITVFFMLPMLIDTVSGHAGFRFSYISIFTAPHREQITDTLRYEDIVNLQSPKVGVATPMLSYLLHNKYELVLEAFFKNYLSSFSTTFLFLTGDLNPRHGFGSFGLLYLLDGIFIIYGIFLYFKKPDKFSSLFFWWLIFAPISFALTRDSDFPHATRLILMLPPFIYFAARGVGRKYYVLPIYFLMLLNFWHFYTIHYPQQYAQVWHAVLKESVLATNKYPDQQIVFSDSFEPFMPFFLFYHPYLPQKLPITSNITHVSIDYFDGSSLQNQYFFGHVNWSIAAQNAKNTIFVVPQNEFKTISNISDYNILLRIPKAYLSSQDFYLITPTNETKK